MHYDSIYLRFSNLVFSLVLTRLSRFLIAQFPEMTTRAMAMLNDYVLVGGNTMVRAN